MEERLIELMRQAEFAYLDFSKMYPYEKSLTDFTADYLLANGVIVPPCKVGDVVYKPIITDDTREPAIWDITISQISIETGKLFNEAYAVGTICKSNSGESFDFKEIGKTVFLTKEEAEQALKGGVQE